MPNDEEANTSSQDASTLHDKPRARSSVVIENFSILWFAVSMDTGILSIIMNQNPYQFSGLGVISTIMFVFNIVLFAAFLVVLLLKGFMFPKQLFHSLTSDLTELGMLGGACISYLTIVAQVGLTVSNANWGGHAFTIVAYVMWWIGVGATLFVVALAFTVVAKYNVSDTSKLTPALVVPFVAITTLAVIGGLLANFSFAISSRLAVPMLVVSYLAAGIGILGSSLVFAVYLVRLINYGLPPMEQSPTLFLLVGPIGQGASAMMQLGAAASKYFAAYAKGTVLTSSGGSVFSAAGVLLGLLLVGLAVLFTIFALAVIIEGAFKRQHKYTMFWWGMIFPLATVNTAWISLATAMDSPTFRALSSIFLLALVVAYLVNWGFTLYYLLTGRSLGGVTASKSSAERMLGDGRKVE